MRENPEIVVGRTLKCVRAVDVKVGDWFVDHDDLPNEIPVEVLERRETAKQVFLTHTAFHNIRMAILFEESGEEPEAGEYRYSKDSLLLVVKVGDWPS